MSQQDKTELDACLSRMVTYANKAYAWSMASLALAILSVILAVTAWMCGR